MAEPVYIFSDDYYARLAEIEERHWWAAGVRATAARMLDRFAPPQRDWRVLDAGCGTGLTIRWLKRYTDIEPVGFDLAPEGLRYCRRRGCTRLAESDTRFLPFRNEHFQLVVSADVIQHLPRPGGDALALAEMARVLCPVGLLLLRTNARCGYPATDSPMYHRYRLHELRGLIESAGFQIHAATYVNFVPGLLATLRMKLARRDGSVDPGLRARPVPPETNLLTRTLYGTLLAEGMFVASGKRALPFGHSTLVLAEKCASTRPCDPA
jgi:ubiquinone/menaquinone biosynthesis C-methylase UbiE